MLKSVRIKDLYVRLSVLTDEPVWLYEGASSGARRVAYHYACQCEHDRVARWREREDAFRKNVMTLLNNCLSSLPFGSELTEEQRRASRDIQKMAKEGLTCDRQFYDHIIEEARLRKF